MAKLLPLKSGYYVWHYLPNRIPAAIFAILFLCSALVHLWKLFRTKSWFCIALTIGAIMETMGFAVRIEAYSHTDKLGVYIMQSMFILLAPILFAATIYMTLSRIIRSVPEGPTCSPITPRKLTRYFVIGDITSLCVQGNSTPFNFVANGKYAKYGTWIVIAGLVLQLILFALFATTAMVFDKRYSRLTHSRRDIMDSYTGGRPLWKKNIFMLYGVSLLIMIRSIYRVIEFSQGQEGYFMTHEWSLYLFDALLMWIVTVIYGIWYPSNLTAPQTAPAMVQQDTEYIPLDAGSPVSKR